MEQTTWLDHAGSTNSFLADAPPVAGGHAVLTWNQTAGHGRLGREWVSPEGKALAISVELGHQWAPDTPGPEWLGALSLLAGVSLAEAIAPHISGEVGLKWPNDVLIDGQKVSGILGTMPHPGRVIVGVGLNVWLDRDELPTEFATSLALHGLRNDVSVEVIVRDFLRRLHHALGEAHEGLTPDQLSWVTRRLLTLGHSVHVDYPDGSSRIGVALDIDTAGRLLVEFEDTTQVEPVSAADVWHLRAHPG